MQRKELFCIFISAISVATCSTPPQPKPTTDFPIQTVQWSPEKFGDLKDIIRKTECIALENSPEAAFSSIDQIAYHDNQFYIFDKYGSNKLLVFNDKGNYVRSFGRKGHGPGEYIELESFSIKNDTIFLLDPNGQKILVYDAHGEFLDEIETGTEYPDQAIWLSDGFLFYKALYQDEPVDNTAAVSKTNEKAQIVQTYFGYHEFSPRASYAQTFTESDSVILFNRYFNDTVIDFNRGGEITQGIYFDFGKDAIPENLRSDVKKVQNNKARYSYLASPVVSAGCFLLGTVSDHGKRVVYVKDQRNGHLYTDQSGDIIPALPSNIAAKDSTAIISWISYDVKDSFARSLGTDRLNELIPHLENGEVYLILFYLK